MGILDYGAKVLVQFKGDTKDLESALKRATLAEKEALKAQVDGVKAGNTALEGKVATLAKVGVAIGGMVAAYKAAQVSFELYAQKLDYSSASAGVSIDGLKKASKGLKTEMQLLEFAARTNSGTFKLTQKQMEIAQEAMIGLERKGHDSKEVFEAITTALVEGKTKALAPFGVVIEATGTKAEKLSAIMKALKEETYGVAGSALEADERQAALGVSFQDSMDKIKFSLGEMVVALQPVIEAIAELVSTAAKGFVAIIDAIKEINDLGKDYAHVGRKLPKGAFIVNADGTINKDIDNLVWQRESEILSLMDAGGLSRREAENAVNNRDSNYAGVSAAAPAGKAKSRPRRSRGGGGGRGSSGPMLTPGAFDWNLGGDPWSDWTRSNLTDPLGSPALDVGLPMKRIIPEGTEGQLDKMAESYQKFRTEQGQTFMEQAFGPIEQFDAYGAAFGVLTTTLTSGFDAWVNGSESFGQAMKAAFKQSLGAVASDMFAKSVQHAAYALGSLAFGDFRGAATHGAAAGAFAAGALTIGSLARSMGGGASAGLPAGGTTGVGGTAPVLPAYTGGESSGNRQVTLVIGDDFAEDSPRKRAAKAGRYLQMGMRATGPTGVAFA